MTRASHDAISNWLFWLAIFAAICMLACLLIFIITGAKLAAEMGLAGLLVFILTVAVADLLEDLL